MSEATSRPRSGVRSFGKQTRKTSSHPTNLKSGSTSQPQRSTASSSYVESTGSAAAGEGSSLIDEPESQSTSPSRKGACGNVKKSSIVSAVSSPAEPRAEPREIHRARNSNKNLTGSTVASPGSSSRAASNRTSNVDGPAGRLKRPQSVTDAADRTSSKSKTPSSSRGRRGGGVSNEDSSASNDTQGGTSPRSRGRRGTSSSRARRKVNDADSRAPLPEGDTEDDVPDCDAGQNSPNDKAQRHGNGGCRGAAGSTLSQRGENSCRTFRPALMKESLRTTKEEDLALVLALLEEHESLLAVRARVRKELVALQGEEDELRVSLGFPAVHPVSVPSSPPRSALETHVVSDRPPAPPEGYEREPVVKLPGKRPRTVDKPHAQSIATSSVVSSTEVEPTLSLEAPTDSTVGAVRVDGDDDTYLERILLGADENEADSDQENLMQLSMTDKGTTMLSSSSGMQSQCPSSVGQEVVNSGEKKETRPAAVIRSQKANEADKGRDRTPSLLGVARGSGKARQKTKYAAIGPDAQVKFRPSGAGAGSSGHQDGDAHHARGSRAGLKGNSPNLTRSGPGASTLRGRGGTGLRGRRHAVTRHGTSG